MVVRWCGLVPCLSLYIYILRYTECKEINTVKLRTEKLFSRIKNEQEDSTRDHNTVSRVSSERKICSSLEHHSISSSIVTTPSLLVSIS